MFANSLLHSSPVLYSISLLKTALQSTMIHDINLFLFSRFLHSFFVYSIIPFIASSWEIE